MPDAERRPEFGVNGNAGIGWLSVKILIFAVQAGMMNARNLFLLILLLFLAGTPRLRAQCSICTRTVQQMGERPARALNSGIIYLAITPLAIFGLIGYRWWRSNREEEKTK